MKGWWALAAWLALINAWGVAQVLLDKGRARRGGWRVPERRFFLIALLGGCPGVYLAMRLRRHKTLHRRFMWGLPLIFAAQAAMVIFLYFLC